MTHDTQGQRRLIFFRQGVTCSHGVEMELKEDEEAVPRRRPSA